MVKRERLDVLLVRKGFFKSQERAKAAILEGKVFVDGKRSEKAGALINLSGSLKVVPDFPYLSRGALKLKKALNLFKIKLQGKVVLDGGAGIGGFTDLLLKGGAKRVIAVDVGYGEFAYSLRQNPKVFLLERTNLRYLHPNKLPQAADLATIDLSFISIKKIAENLKNLLESQGEVLILVKPQFEAGPLEVGKKGVVTDFKVHQRILKELWTFLEEDFGVKGLTYSPILGKEGNIEFWLYLSLHPVRNIKIHKGRNKISNGVNGKTKRSETTVLRYVNKVVKEAHRSLNQSAEGGRFRASPD